MQNSDLLWTPSQSRVLDARITEFISFVQDAYGLEIEDYSALHHWSVTESARFWEAVWDFFDVIGDKGKETLLNPENIEKAVWFPDGQLNFCENLLRSTGTGVAIYFQAEDKVSSQLTWDQLREQVGAIAAWLKNAGVGPGDRVAGLLPNMPEAIVAMLATASLGGVWTSTSPDFGVESVIERFGQTEPKVLFTADGYYYNGKLIDIRSKVEEVQTRLPTVQHTAVIRFAHQDGELPGLEYQSILADFQDSELHFTPVNFNAPLYILYSSGTTGKPKCIVHKTGAVLLQHLKEHGLQSDVRAGDRLFYFTTCGWMMWNWLVSGLASSATVVLYDGSPFYPDANVLWDYADKVDLTLFGTSAKYIDALKKKGCKPGSSHKLSSLRTLCSTGSVLVPESFDYVYEAIKEDICLASISGGTDIVSCFFLGCPVLPVYRGESQCLSLGMSVEVYDEEGNSIIGRKGELVCTRTFPVQPLGFWGDETGSKYHNAYYNRYPNVWHHGDYIEITPRGGVIVYGRSDATLNPGGVRIGTAEIYRYVEQLDTVMESIVVGQEYEGDVRVVLFVVLKPGQILDDDLERRIRLTIRENCSPRHVPAVVLQVDEIPRTKSGKIVELAVKEIIHGRPVKNISALANPDALDHFADRQELS